MMGTNLIVDKEINTIQPVWQTIREYLESKKDQISKAILYYPPLIPACDAQFNYLLEERARLSQLLGQLESLAQEQPGQEQRLWLDAFLLSSPDLDEAAVQAIHSFLQDGEDKWD
jgi:hypothetical protein